MIRESLSYWQETAVPTPLSSDLPSSVDVAIVGGGILGASIGYWLARAGIDAAAALGYDVGVRQSQPTAEVQMALEQVFP